MRKGTLVALAVLSFWVCSPVCLQPDSPHDELFSLHLIPLVSVNRDLYPQARELRQQIDQDPRDVRLMNRLGVLYARYGVLDKAEDAFTQVLAAKEYPPALMNMGNIMRAKNNLTEARRYYARAYARMPKDDATLLGLVKLTYELGLFKETEGYYQQLKKLDSRLAERFSYLGSEGGRETARAANAEAMKDEMVWGE